MLFFDRALLNCIETVRPERRILVSRRDWRHVDNGDPELEVHDRPSRSLVSETSASSRSSRRRELAAR